MAHSELEILKVKTVCKLLGISVPTLYRWCKERDDFPPKLKLGRSVVGFRKRDIEAFLDNAESKN